jgi:hypothetical protein
MWNVVSDHHLFPCYLTNLWHWCFFLLLN